MMEEVSKSQKKREATALQELGLQLLEFSAETLDLFPLSDPLRQAIDLAKTIKSHGAKRRQAQLIGKLMRSSDFAAIKAAVEKLQAEKNAQTKEFHELEIWRERLITDKTALTEFIEQYPIQDIQLLRQLIKKAQNEREAGKSLGASKALFRYLRTLVMG